MGTVTAYNLSNVQTALGGVNPISMNEYYRGGSYVPTTASSREPTTGEYYNEYSYFWRTYGPVNGNVSMIYWNGVNLSESVPAGATSYTISGYTYYKGTFYTSYVDEYTSYSQYGIYRTSSTSINTGVPSSGTISIFQLFGARNP
jgi:hypothetical protein